MQLKASSLGATMKWFKEREAVKLKQKGVMMINFMKEEQQEKRLAKESKNAESLERQKKWEAEEK